MRHCKRTWETLLVRSHSLGISAKMELGSRLLVIALGICVVASYVTSVKVYNPTNDDITGAIEGLKKAKIRYETLLKGNHSQMEKLSIEEDLRAVINRLHYRETTSRVPYLDYTEMVERYNTQLKQQTEYSMRERAQLEKDKENMQKQLVKAENECTRANNEMATMKKKNEDVVATYEERLKESAKKLEKIQKEYEALKQMQAKKEETGKQEKEQLVNVKSELTKKLKEAHRLHAKAIEVTSMSLEAPNIKEPIIPLQNDIKEWKKSVVAMSNSKSKKTKVAGLQKTLDALKELNDKLKEKNNDLGSGASFHELEEKLADMKANTQASKSEQMKKRNALLGNLRQQQLENYKEKEIDELKKINEEVLAWDVFLKELSLRKAYVKAMEEVDSLMKYCKDEIKKAERWIFASLPRGASGKQ